MSPRRYNKTKREATSDVIRHRILEATLELHSKKGIFGTSWKDIAKRADVSLATVYNYFPSLDELVPACGDLMYSITQPPSLESANEVFTKINSIEDRLALLVKTFFDFYERGELYLNVDQQERTLDSVQEWEAYLKSLTESYTQSALKPTKPSKKVVETISALIDVPVFLSFRRRGMSRAEIEKTMNSLLLSWINNSD